MELPHRIWLAYVASEFEGSDLMQSMSSMIPLFNKSKRKACVIDLIAYDSKGQPIPVAWSDTIDDLGNVSKRANLVGITDEKTVYARRNYGEPFLYARILFAHSFSTAKEIAVFDPAADFARAVE